MAEGSPQERYRREKNHNTSRSAGSSTAVHLDNNDGDEKARVKYLTSTSHGHFHHAPWTAPERETSAKEISPWFLFLRRQRSHGAFPTRLCSRARTSANQCINKCYGAKLHSKSYLLRDDKLIQIVVVCPQGLARADCGKSTWTWLKDGAPYLKSFHLKRENKINPSLILGKQWRDVTLHETSSVMQDGNYFWSSKNW